MSRHKCTKDIYKAFLQASCIRYSGAALSEVSPEPFSHDSVSHWLRSQHFRPREVWQLTHEHVDFNERGFLICDDTVLDKHRSQKIELVHYQYSGNTHDVIAGIGLVNFLWQGLESKESVPVDYRVYDKDTDGKTKNDHFREMLRLAKQRGIKPEAVVIDAWYSSLDNLKALRDMEWDWVAGLKKNRRVNRKETLASLHIPDEGLKIHLRGYGWVTVFRFVAKNGRTDYIGTSLKNPSRDQVERIMKARWGIEIPHSKYICKIDKL